MSPLPAYNANLYKSNFCTNVFFSYLDNPKTHTMLSLLNRLYKSIIEERKILFILPLVVIAYLILFFHLN